MGKNIYYVLSSFFTFLCISSICATILYSCSAASDRYYKAMSECVMQGGSWIPAGEYKANCVFGRSK